MACTITEACIGCTACVKVCPVAAIAGERKTLHRIDPARCIECEACGRICPSAAINDPEGIPIPRLARPLWKRPVFDLDKCISCACCADRCPVACIDMEGGEDGGVGAIPRLARPAACVSCAWCSFYCPASCIELKPGAGDPGGAT